MVPTLGRIVLYRGRVSLIDRVGIIVGVRAQNILCTVVDLFLFPASAEDGGIGVFTDGVREHPAQECAANADLIHRPLGFDTWRLASGPAATRTPTP
jgi:hypothetical protein